MNKDKAHFQYNSGDLVYIISPVTSQLRTASRKSQLNMLVHLQITKLLILTIICYLQLMASCKEDYLNMRG